MLNKLAVESCQYVSNYFDIHSEAIELVKPVSKSVSEVQDNKLENICDYLRLHDWEAVVIHQSSKIIGYYQAQFFNRAGFLNDTQHYSLDVAISSVISMGFYIPARGLLSQCITNNEFVK